MTPTPALRAELQRLEQEAALSHEPARQKLLRSDQRDTLRLVEGRIRLLRQELGSLDA